MAKAKKTLSKRGWRLQKALVEIEEWNTWIQRSAAIFFEEVKEVPEGDYTPTQFGGISQVRAELNALTATTKKMEKALRRAISRRIRRKA